MVDAVSTALRTFGGLNRRELRNWVEWAEKHPSEAEQQLRIYAQFAEHRYTLLQNREGWVYRRKHRMRRWISIAIRLYEEADRYKGKLLFGDLNPQVPPRRW